MKCRADLDRFYWHKRNRTSLNRRKKSSNQSAHIKNKQTAAQKILKVNIRLDQWISVVAPKVFSLIKNPEQTSRTFDTLTNLIKNGHQIKLDLSSVESITIDSILYYLALTANIASKNYLYRIRGIYPKNKEIQELLTSSGFTKMVKSSTLLHTPKSDCIEIKIDSLVLPNLVKEICEFTQNKLSIPRTHTRKLYDAISEIMLNTKQHAYTRGVKAIPNWYLYARHEATENKVSFALLDTGAGIPRTIRKKKNESIKQAISALGLNSIAVNDSEFIHSALDGAFRTRTGKTYRGKGLPKIQRLSDERYLENLHVISNRGAITPSGRFNISKSIGGTIYYWEISRDSYENSINSKELH